MKYFSRDKELINLVKGASVLHLGCVGFADSDVGERVNNAKKSLHYTLSNITDVIGVDYCRDAIDFFRKKKIFTNVMYGNVEQLDDLKLENKFDVIVIGDIIEHLSNPGLMLEGIKRFCHSNTKVVITTPHSFGLLNYVRFIFNKFKDGNEHMMTFNIDNIKNILSMHEYDIISVDTCYQKHAESKLLFSIGRMFFMLHPKYGGTLFIVTRFKCS